MQGDRFRVGVVGASSMLGKELSDELAESAFAAGTIVLLDAETGGQVSAVGDEAAIVQALENDSFDGLDFVFFAGAPETTEDRWRAARAAGATVLDATFALNEEPEALLWSPWVEETGAAKRPDLRTSAVVLVHPVALLLAEMARRLRSAGIAVQSLAATLLQPASEYGREGMDELHQQTVSLLSFQEVPKATFDAQTAFNLLPELGEHAPAASRLSDVRATVLEHYGSIAGAGAPALHLQVVQAPVFHGYGLSLFVASSGEVRRDAVEAALRSERIEVAQGKDAELPSNVAVAGRAPAMVQVSDAAKGGFWLWASADNLKLTAREAVATALALRGLRPQGKVQ